mgnify:CR=1 FL=1
MKFGFAFIAFENLIVIHRKKITKITTINLITSTCPENDCLRFRFASPHQDKGTLPVPLQRLLVRGLRDVK